MEEEAYEYAALGSIAVEGVPPAEIRFVMVQPVYRCADGRQQLTFHVFTAAGIRSRTAQRTAAGWNWLVSYHGERIGWARAFPLDGETLESLRAWHEREHGWRVIAHTVAE
jgi:hypothetical protein